MTSQTLSDRGRIEGGDFNGKSLNDDWGYVGLGHLYSDRSVVYR